MRKIWNTVKPILALLLALCILLGQAPALAAESRASESKGEWLVNQVKDLNKKGGGTISLSGEYYLPEPITITSSITFTGEGTIRADDFGPWFTGATNSEAGRHNGLIFINGPCHVSITGTVVIDAQGKCRAIQMSNGAALHLEGCTIKNGFVDASESGGAINVGDGTLYAGGNTTFEENQCATGSPTSGGAIYVGQNGTAELEDVTFQNNAAHSGGAIYTYHGLVLCNEQTKFIGNRASQRGGAIHSHGLVCLSGTTISGQTSDQYGGAIYVSANKTGETYDFGRLVLDNATIIGNHCYNTGAGIYVADQAQVLVSGNTQIIDNKIIGGTDPNEPDDSNIFVATANSKLIVDAPLTCDAGKIGVSTSNPYHHKALVYSLIPSYLPEQTGATRAPVEEWFAGGFPTNYTMTSADMGKFQYDSQAFLLTQGSDEHKDDMWLTINRNYPNGSASSEPSVVFDYNLPGKQALVYPSAETMSSIKLGDKITLPEVDAKIPGGAVDYYFQGWYSDAQGGQHYTDSITVEEGTRVYYAQWIPKPVGGGGTGVAGDAGLQLVYYDQNYDGGGFTTAYTFGGQFTFTVVFQGPDGPTSEDVDVYVPFELPSDPVRFGYEFTGWSEDPNSSSGVFHSSGWAPSKAVTTLYATWRAKSFDITWDANDGVGGCVTNQRFDEALKLPTQPTREGYSFVGWYLDKAGSVSLVSGATVRGDITYYAKWSPLEYTITWDANYTGGGITSIKQHHDEKLYHMPAPTREGYGFVGWNTKKDGSGISGDPDSYGTIRQDETFYAQWDRNVQSYTVKIEWDDLSNNDNVRPESISVQLMANGIPAIVNNQPVTYTFNASEHTGDIWTHPFHGLPVTDAVSNPITYSVAITSTVSDQYSYGIENKSASLGYILLTHSLITRDVDAYVVWDDNANQDGVRPPTVTLQLYANDKPMADSEYRIALSGSGDTWFYRFHDVQKYYTDASGNKGQEIKYTIKATATNTGELNGYADDYHEYTAILSHEVATVSRTVQVDWQDNNDQDGKRPASMSVQLYADNVPLEGKTVTLSAANGWSHTWDNLPKYADEGREVAYSARVSSSVVDYTAKSTGMNIEMTYVPSSTSISAFVVWTDENDADGLRPDYIIADLMVGDDALGFEQVLSADSGWTTTWSNLPIYENGNRIEYKLAIKDVPGYKTDYRGVYDITGLSAVLTHERITQSLTGNIVWDDDNNASGARMGQVTVLLCADGSVIDDRQTVAINAASDWAHTFENLPKYRDHGEEIRYSIILASASGQYEATTSGMTITMRLNPEFVDVPFQIIWDDNNDSDGKRPLVVTVELLANSTVQEATLDASAGSGWAVTFTKLDKYNGGSAYRYIPQLKETPEGYEISHKSDNMVVLKRVAETKDVTATVIWQDNNDQYSQRPSQVTLTLYADRLDGNGPQNTGIVEKCKATEGWVFTFKDMPAHHNGKNIIYSVVASGDLPNYTVFEDGMDVYMKHKGYNPDDVTTEYTATVIWHNNYHNNKERPTEVTLVLRDNEGNTYRRPVTAANADTTGYTWWYTFSNLPTNLGNGPLTYEVGVETPKNYTAKILGQTIILTQVRDIPILVRWNDQRNNDRVRPSELTLELSANGVKDGTAITITGGNTDETWRGTFEALPVWNGPLSSDEVQYAWEFAGTELAEKGYSVDTHNFKSTTEGIETVYPIDISREIERKPVTATISWDDAGDDGTEDQDGLRPDSITVRLLADGVDTGESVTVSGSNTEKTWNTTFADLPVLKDGEAIQYELQTDELDGYTAKSSFDENTHTVTLTLKHDIAMADISANVVWDDDSNSEDLKRFPIHVRLVTDGVPQNEVLTIPDTDTTVSFGELPVYYDHGKIHEYTVQVTEDTEIPPDYEVAVAEDDGLTVTVKRAWFHLSGRVLDYAGEPIPKATVSLYSSGDSTVSTVETDDGYFSFVVAPGSYIVTGEVISGGYLSASAQVTVTNADVTQDIRLAWGSGITIIGNVVTSDGEAASGSRIEFELFDVGISGVVSADENGKFQITNLPRGTYQFRAYYTYGDKVYLSETFYAGPYDKNPIEVDIQIAIPQEGALLYSVSGTVKTMAGKPMEDVIVLCTGSKKYSAPSTVVGATTNKNGEFTLYGLPQDTYDLIFKTQDRKVLTAIGDKTFTVPHADPLEIIIWGNATQDTEAPGYGILSGVVLNKDGQGIKDAQVIVTDKSTGALSTVLVTDANGAFNVELPGGEYTVELWKPFENNTDIPVHVNDQEADKPGSPVTTDSFTVSGTVLDEDGEPSEGITVYLYGEDDQAIEAVLLQPEEDEVDEVTSLKEIAASFVGATFSVADLVEDSLGAIAETEAEIAEAVPVEDVLDEAEPVEVEAEESDMAEDRPQPTEDTQDDVDALSVEGGYVRLDERVTAEDGKYSFEGLPAGRYVVKIARGLGGNGGSTDIPVVVAAIPEIPDDADLTVTTDSYTVSGVVEGTDGLRVNGAAVTLLDEQGEEVASMATKKDGVYEFAALPKGEYTVNISYPDSELLAKGDVTLPDGGFVAFPGCAVTGTVKDSKGNTLANAAVTFTGAEHTYTATTDKNGIYHVAVPDGKYTVEASYSDKTASKVITVTGQDTKADLTITLTTSGGNTTPGGSTNPGGGSSSGGGSGSGGGSMGGGVSAGGGSNTPAETKTVLSGTVTDKNGKGVEGATVTATDTKTGETYTAITGPDGAYALAVPKGSYTLTITYGGTASTPKSVSVSKDTAVGTIAMEGLGNWVTAYVTGYTDGTFGGNKHISRSEVAALISRVAPGFDKDKTYSVDFKDVSEDVWYANNLGYCVQAGLIQGRGNGHFDPNASITRAEFAAIVARFLGLENTVTGGAAYPDIAGNWAEGYITQLTAKGIVQGKDDGKFDPNAPITRYEAVTMLNRALGRTPDKETLDTLSTNLIIRPFSDLTVGHWAYYQVLEAAFNHFHK